MSLGFGGTMTIYQYLSFDVRLFAPEDYLSYVEDETLDLAALGSDSGMSLTKFVASVLSSGL